MIEVKNLTKKYGSTTAVDDVSFKIRNGKIYGFLGPNGAGKSTTMNIIAGCLAATSGTVLINGCDVCNDPIEAKKQIGYLPEIPPLYADMTAFEYLHFVAEAKGVKAARAEKQVNEVMEQTGITHMKNRLISGLSKGYKQRVGIAQAMLGNPDVIILDEPTVGLDPQQIIEIRELIRKLGQSKTVILSSHILAEISEVCDHIIIISRGKIVADNTLQELESRVSDQATLHMSIKGERAGILDVIACYPNVRECKVLSDKAGIVELELSLPRGLDIRDELFFAMAEKRYAVINIEQKTASLEEVFLSLTDKTQGTVDKRALREKKRRDKMLGNVKEEARTQNTQEDEEDCE
ncbi:MAG: ABC transporter ATP-binding protein [Clostridia bacterium]|nr:ABC transporter ATP-binding protein [Clostridia bacterium]